MTATDCFSVLVLAGSRADASDELAAETGCSHKALVPVAGSPMLERVLRSVAAQGGLRRVTVSSDRRDLLEALPPLPELGLEVAVEHHQSAASPAASVLDFLESAGAGDPVLVTTADHPLLTAEMISYFWSEAVNRRVEVAVGVVSESLFRRCYPDLRRTFVRLGGEAFSGANLFAFMTPGAAAAARFWTGAEKHRKHPARLVRLFGVRNLLRFLLRRFDVDTATSEVSRIFGVGVALVEMPFAECAIDVDRPADLSIVSSILEARPKSPT